MASKNQNIMQQTNLLIGARNAYQAFQRHFENVSFRVATKNMGSCGAGWFPSPSDLTRLSAIAVVGSGGNVHTYQIHAVNPEWTEFSEPQLLGHGGWVGAAPYNPMQVNFTPEESFTRLEQYFAVKGYVGVKYTQVSLVNQSYPPFQIAYGYDCDLKQYGFEITQFITTPENAPTGQTNEAGYCPLPA